MKNCICCNRNIAELKEDLSGYCRRCYAHNEAEKTYSGLKRVHREIGKINERNRIREQINNEVDTVTKIAKDKFTFNVEYWRGCLRGYADVLKMLDKKEKQE